MDEAGQYGGGRVHVSLLEAAALLTDEDEELSIATHRSLLKRRFSSSDTERAVLDEGVAAMSMLAAARSEERARLRQDETLDELRIALAESRADAARAHKRAEQVEHQLRLLAEARPPPPLAAESIGTALAPHAHGISVAASPRLASTSEASAVALSTPTPEPGEEEAAPASAHREGAATTTASSVSAGAAPDAPRRVVEELQQSRLAALGGVGGSSLGGLVGRALSAL